MQGPPPGQFMPYPGAPPHPMMMAMPMHPYPYPPGAPGPLAPGPPPPGGPAPGQPMAPGYGMYPMPEYVQGDLVYFITNLLPVHVSCTLTFLSKDNRV